jgi:hypothetical protein
MSIEILARSELHDAPGREFLLQVLSDKIVSRRSRAQQGIFRRLFSSPLERLGLTRQPISTVYQGRLTQIETLSAEKVTGPLWWPSPTRITYVDGRTLSNGTSSVLQHFIFTPEEVTCFREGDYLMIGSAMNYTLGDGVGDSLSQDVAVYFDEAPNRKIPSGGVQTFASYF